MPRPQFFRPRTVSNNITVGKRLSARERGYTAEWDNAAIGAAALRLDGPQAMALSCELIELGEGPRWRACRSALPRIYACRLLWARAESATGHRNEH